MKLKSLLLSAAVGAALSASAVPQGTITTPDIVITDANVGTIIEVPLTLGDLGTITGEETGFDKYDNVNIGDAKLWKNIQFNFTFPEGLRPAQDEYGTYGFPGADLLQKPRNQGYYTEFSDNFSNTDFYPNHKLLGANMTATWQPGGEIWVMNVKADEDMPNGEYEFLFYCKWIDQADGDNTINEDNNRGVLCKVIVDRTVEPQTRTLEGVVVDVNANPLEGVSVTAIPEEGETVTGTTDAAGAYSMEVDANATYTLTFSKDGYVTVENLPEGDANTVTLEYVMRALEGTVVDENNEPIEGVAVTATATDADATYETVTDENGLYTFEVIDLYDYTLDFAKNGYVPQTGVSEEEATTVTLAYELRTLAGTVVDENGDALAGVTVTVVANDNDDVTYEATTDENGAYSIEAIAMYDYTFTFALEGYETQEGVAEADAANVTMILSTRTIEGVVVDSASKNPLEGVTVTATLVVEQPEGLLRLPVEPYTAITDANGAYSIEVPALGEYELTFTKDNYLPQTVAETEADNVELVLDPSTGVSVINADVNDGVTYFNAAGMSSDKPFDGINIVVTRNADGTTTVAKVVK